MKPEEINALPEPARRYIMLLETESDPAGTIRENARLRDENEFLRTECAALARDWRPIEAAPKDGTQIMVCGGTYHYSGATFPDEMPLKGVATVGYDQTRENWKGEQGEQYDEFFWYKPTHWMPLPVPYVDALVRSLHSKVAADYGSDRGN